jgi:hypothetical protein
MPDYRTYIVGIDGQFNSIITEFPHNHPDDAAAIKVAKQLADGYDFELWDGDRLVGRFSPSRRRGILSNVASVGGLFHFECRLLFSALPCWAVPINYQKADREKANELKQDCEICGYHRPCCGDCYSGNGSAE